VRDHPEVASLARVLERDLPIDSMELVLFDYTYAVRRATVAAMLAAGYTRSSAP
jgi:hypothetical protein